MKVWIEGAKSPYEYKDLFTNAVLTPSIEEFDAGVIAEVFQPSEVFSLVKLGGVTIDFAYDCDANWAFAGEGVKSNGISSDDLAKVITVDRSECSLEADEKAVLKELLTEAGIEFDGRAGIAKLRKLAGQVK